MDEIVPRPNKCEPINIRKSAFGRTNLFLSSTTTLFREIKCSASSATRQASASLYHIHSTTQKNERPENCVCWHCCHNFDGVGFRLPRAYDPNERLYHVYGWFCSANCSKAYILEHSNFDRGYQMNVFVRMLREVYGIESGIVESPPRIALKMFGGPFDIETFRQQKNVCFVVTPPFVSYCMLIEERSPIENIGESSKTTGKHSRGSVRGLRKPDVKNYVTEDEMCSPEPNDGMYEDFLKQDIDNDICDMDVEITKQSKKQKVVKEKKHENGLARFMCK